MGGPYGSAGIGNPGRCEQAGHHSATIEWGKARLSRFLLREALAGFW